MGPILSRLPHTTWRHIRTRQPPPVRARLSIDARSCAKPVQKKTRALARSIGTPVLECFLAFYRLVENFFEFLHKPKEGISMFSWGEIVELYKKVQVTGIWIETLTCS